MPRSTVFCQQTTVMVFTVALLITAQTQADPWTQHTIDGSSQGADGVRLADVNGDGRLDVATGWEEGGVVRIYLSPARQAVRQPWPMIQVGRVTSCEDAVFADVDSDGHLDVVSCCEGRINTVYVHWNPGVGNVDRRSSDRRSPWQTTAFPQLEGRLPWMYCLPILNQKQQVAELAVGSKGGSGEIGLLIPPEQGHRRDLSTWTWRRLGPAGWIMSIRSADIDGDGLVDLICSDRRGPGRGIHWFRRPARRAAAWQPFRLGGQDREVMFLDINDLNADGRRDIVCAARDSHLLVLLGGQSADQWTSVEIPYPANVGTGKGIAVGDIDGNQIPDLVCTCEQAKDKSGVYWLSPSTDIHGPWTFHDVSGAERGIKFDRIELCDLDDDGDLDILTCEERHNLGVIWYENPHQHQSGAP